MSTKRVSKALLGVLSASLLAAPAFAGGNCGAAGCGVPVHVMPGYAPEFGPMTIRTQQPMGHLRSIDFQRAPNVSIMRVHGMNPTAGLSDAPSGFTDGCHPTSTTYCRQDAGRPVQVEFNAPAPAPVPLALYSPPAPVVAPSEPRVVRIGGGYDPSKFTPRVYGDPTFVPGIAHIPTSIVDRDPVRAQQVLDSGRAVPQPVVVPGRSQVPQAAYNHNMAPAVRFAPQIQGPVNMGPRFGRPGAPVLQQSGPMAGAYGSSVGGDGTYWEKVSGPTAFGDTIATSVICKRQLPRQVVRPIIGVPVPVPVPVPVQQGCAPTHVQAPHAHQGPAHNRHQGGRYGQQAPGRWIQ